jgi:hypothetical protein
MGRRAGLAGRRLRSLTASLVGYIYLGSVSDALLPIIDLAYPKTKQTFKDIPISIASDPTLFQSSNLINRDTYNIYTTRNTLHQNPISLKMRLTAVTTILFATVALANPVAQPTAALGPASLAPEVDARAASMLEERKTKKPKSSGNKSNDTEAAGSLLAPSRVLELGALGLGVMEVVRLWV